MKYTKHVLIAVIAVLMSVMLPVAALASAETLPASYAGNVDYLIDIRNPESVISSTTGKSCTLSAVAVPGTVVTLYSFNESTNTYEKLYSDGKALETTVGASGFYAQSISLKNGLNTILVVASTNKDTVETTRLEITLLKTNVSENVKSLWQSLMGY